MLATGKNQRRDYLGMKSHTVIRVSTGCGGTGGAGVELTSVLQGSGSSSAVAGARFVLGGCGEDDLHPYVSEKKREILCRLSNLITSSNQFVVLFAELSNCPPVVIGKDDLLGRCAGNETDETK